MSIIAYFIGVNRLTKERKLTINNTSPQRLYLFPLSFTTLPLPNGILEMVTPCYLVQTNDGKNILIDTGVPADYSPAAGTPPATEVTNVLQHLDALGLHPQDIDTLICTHFDIDHCGYHDAFPKAEFIVQREHYELAR